jgi:glutathione S-transferase
MITIHGSAVSPFVRKVLVLLTEKGIDFSVNPIMPFPAPAEHLAISPTGKIPALTDGDFSLPDSSAICGYLEKKYPDINLYPLTAEDYGRALWFEDYADNEVVSVTAAFFFNKIAVKMMGREPDEAIIQQIRDKKEPKVLPYLEREIGDKDFIVGNQFSIADIAITCQFVQRLYADEAIDSEQYPNIARYVELHMHRDSFKQWINKDGFMTIA